MIDILRKVDRLFYNVERTLIVVFVFSMTGLVLLSILCRNVPWIGRDFPWMFELTQIMVLWCAFIGGSLASRFNRHININLFPYYLRKKPRLGRFIDALLSLVVMVVAGFLCISAYGFVKMEYEFGEILPSMGIKLWAFQTILIYIFIMVSFRYLIRSLEYIRGRPLPEEVEEAE